MNNRSVKIITLLATSALLTLFSLLAFINNISVVAAWRTLFIKTNGNATLLPKEIGGIIPFLNWSAVDYSCVSTFIPFLGFLLLTKALTNLLLNRCPATDHFPYFKSYDQLNVTLGLVGTLFGIILIGYYDMETVTMASLMTCLHTALFSTLVAVVWVFIIVHPVIVPVVTSLIDKTDLPEDPDQIALTTILGDLRVAADTFCAVLEKEGNTARAFSSALLEAKSQITAVSEELHTQTSALRTREEELLSIYKSKIDEITAITAKATLEMAKAQDQSNTLLTQGFEQRLEAMDKADMERRKKFAESLAIRLTEIENAQLEREKKFDEILSLRIKKLSEESLKNSEKALELEGRLSQIRSFLK